MQDRRPQIQRRHLPGEILDRRQRLTMVGLICASCGKTIPFRFRAMAGLIDGEGPLLCGVCNGTDLPVRVKPAEKDGAE